MRVEKVAKSVQCEEPISISKPKGKAARESGRLGRKHFVVVICNDEVHRLAGFIRRAGNDARRPAGNGNRILLEAPTEFVVLARVEGGRIVRVRAVTPECEVDAGGMALVWLNDVKASESVEWLATLIATAADTRNGMQQVARPALTALGLHADAGAPKLLELARTTKNQEVRKQAMSQLSQSTDPRAIKLFEEILTGK